eukprot:TRINITY_DN10150_c0_g1_i1.p1 TRINITY_DN10150_c0_g1~~TRINITY_DN10150_c0_g1_i1.p1  ORF type:complete len:395 (+),score=53.18 TRINITY_DN10150_c0_g1_i1:64-1185(+)
MSITCKDIFDSLFSPSELRALVTLARDKLTGKYKLVESELTESEKWCYNMLKEVSRSFALVIMQLTGEERRAVCVFYLVLRALDTIEDDMRISISDKVPMLKAFHEKLGLKTYSQTGAGYGHEALLLENYTNVLNVYHSLTAENRKIISENCQEMASGMIVYLTKSVETKEDYNHYCHHVAGIVGYGLTDIFGIEVERKVQDNMGLFLQKVNIIRDYREDQMEDPPRCYWPKEIWGNHAENLSDFLLPEKIDSAVNCLNDLVENALEHVSDVIHYLTICSKTCDTSVFTFCAIPQIMAAATLSVLFQNPAVFSSRVKIRKGVSARILTGCDNRDSALMLLKEFLSEIKVRSEPQSSIYQSASQSISRIDALIC